MTMMKNSLALALSLTAITLPATSAMARSVLAGRRDLPRAVTRALASLGSASVALPQPETAAQEEPETVALAEPDRATQTAPEPVAENHPSQISEPVRRIDKYQPTRAQPSPSRAPRAMSCRCRCA